jgi:DNA (cytosine-5)-methyltransferase 1
MRSVELFAGGGGLTLGTHLAGFSTEVVAEWDRWACDTLRANRDAGHPLVRGIDVRQGDVRDVEWSAVPDGVSLVSGGGLGRAADDSGTCSRPPPR